MNLAEGDVLVGPEVLVPVLRILPQVSETFLQLGFILGDVINNRPEVGERVWGSDPVVCGAGSWSESRSLQAQKTSRSESSTSPLNRTLLKLPYYMRA